MNWNDLLNSRRLERHTTSSAELDGLREVVARDLKDAELAGLSHDRQFAIAYTPSSCSGRWFWHVLATGRSRLRITRPRH